MPADKIVRRSGIGERPASGPLYRPRELGRTLERLRRGKGLSALRLSKLSGVSVNHVRNLERGLRRLKAAVLEALVAALGLDDDTLRPGDLVVMDNLSSHKGARTPELIRGVRAELVYLPPYSPDLNPIEPAFSKIKQALRSLSLRTVDAMWSTMQSVLDQVAGSDAQGFFRHCGYATEIN